MMIPEKIKLYFLCYFFSPIKDTHMRTHKIFNELGIFYVGVELVWAISIMYSQIE